MNAPFERTSHVLPDLLHPGLRLVFCGTAAGATSARRGHYYAHPQNKFWPTLHAVGLTPRRLDPSEYPLLASFGVGLTDIAKTVSGMDKELPAGSLGRLACAALRANILRCQPAMLAFAESHRRAALSPARGRFRRAARDDRRHAHLAASLALAGGELELARERAVVAGARRGGPLNDQALHRPRRSAGLAPQPE